MESSWRRAAELHSTEQAGFKVQKKATRLGSYKAGKPIGWEAMKPAPVEFPDPSSLKLRRDRWGVAKGLIQLGKKA